MFDVQKYIENGIIEEYCFGLAKPEEEDRLLKLAKQYPQIANYLKQTQIKFGLFLNSFHKRTSTRSRAIIKQSISDNLKWKKATLSKNKMLKEYIAISRHTDLALLEKLINDIHPPTEYDNVYAKMLFFDGEKELTLLWVKELAPWEEHPELEESFLILEGTADCYIDDQVFKMEKGDFMQIPPHSNHQIKITSQSPARAIRSRITLN